MKIVGKVTLGLSIAAASLLGIATLFGQAAKPQHKINRAIELLAADQPIYYTGSHSGTTGTFEQGVKDSQTYADYISYDMEHAPFDVKGLSDYMRGLAQGGPCAVNCSNYRGVYSFHAGGANVAFADASVHMLGSGMSPMVFFALVTARGGEVISDLSALY